jgi:hypothetical protein
MYYSRLPRTWNEFSEDNRLRSCIERDWERWFFREQLPHVDNSELRAILTIKSRTLDWQKFAEAIPMSQFLHGVMEDGDLLRLSCGQPVFSGCGISKEDTVRAALKRLLARDLIACFPGVRGSRTPANVYMPVSEARLADMLIANNCPILPQHVRTWHVGEHVKARQGGMWRLVRPEGDMFVAVEVLQGRVETWKEKFLVPPDLNRPTLAEWADFSKQTKLDRSRPALVSIK